MSLTLRCAPILLLSVLVAGAAAGQEEEPVGWPYTPRQREQAVPMPVPATRLPESAPLPAGSDGNAFRGGVIDDGLPPLEHVLLPIAPLRLTFETGRIALSRDEFNRLKRLAERLRAGDERILIVSRARSEGEGFAREALERALARGLLVRELLIGEGVAVRRILMRAEPAPADGSAGETLEIARAD